MNEIIGIIIYLIGCVLCFGRNNAGFYEIAEDFPILKPRSSKGCIPFSFTSWFGFLILVIMYLIGNERYFFKWSRKDLIDKYNNK